MEGRAARPNVTINAAFLQEIKDVHDDLWATLSELDQLVGERIRDRQTAGHLADRLEQLRDQLALHFSLEEAYGYFEDPAEAAPQLCQRAAELKAQHGPLYLDISELAERVAQARFDGKPADIQDAISGYRRFRERFDRHEEAERELIQQVYDDDLGVGD